MVSSVSFTGVYKVNNQDKNAFSKFQEYALNKELKDGVTTSLKDKIIKKGGFGNFEYKAEQTLIVPDYMDVDVETFCANNGIIYSKYDTKDLLRPDYITSRIACPKEGYRVVKVDVKKLEKLAKHEDSNLEHCKNDYYNYYFDNVETMFKSNDEIPATTLWIKNPSGNKNLWRYANIVGANRLDDEKVMVDFIQKTDNPDHCVYFALRAMGLDKIPVYVDNESYEAGRILGLFN